MDRNISKKVLIKERYIKILKYGVVLMLVIAAIVYISNVITTSLDKENLNLGLVDKGSINMTVSATGKVIPYSEEIIVAPISSKILEVYKHAGDTVNIGEALLRLELSSIETEYRQKLDEQEMKRRKLEQSKITLQSSISELEMQERVKEMQLKKMYRELQNEMYLDSIGASTADKIREIALNYDVSKLEYNQLKQRIQNEKLKAEAEMKVQELEYSIFEKGLSENARLLKDARVLSPQKATLTYINNQIGAQVSVGSQIATLSDLSRYKIEAEIADSHASKIRHGARAVVRYGQRELIGTIVNIVPSIKNGTISFSVVYEEDDIQILRNGLSVDVFVEQGTKTNVLRIPNGAYYSNPGEYELWVAKDGKAIKHKVVLGDSNYDYVEVKSGLNEGDEVILMNMNEYKNKESIKIN